MIRLIGNLVGFSIIPIAFVCTAVSRAKKAKKYKTIYITGVVLMAMCSIGILGEAQGKGYYTLQDILELVVIWIIMAAGLIILMSVKKKTVQQTAQTAVTDATGIPGNGSVAPVFTEAAVNPAPMPEQVPEVFTVPEPVTAKGLTLKSDYLNLEIPLDKTVNIGRESAFCDIVFPADTAGVSRRHCAVTATPEGRVFVMDLGSSSGTFLPDGTKLVPNEWTAVDGGFYVASEKYKFIIQ